MIGLIFKIVGDWCNLKCKGCFYYFHDQETKTLMDLSIVEKSLTIAAKEYDRIKCSWHGGEPLLAGLEYFKDIAYIQQKIGHGKFINSVQTNGTLINHDWCEFFDSNKFGVGISLNGTLEFNDEIRINKAGKGTYKTVLKGVNVLRDYGWKKMSVICTVTKNMKDSGKEIFYSLIEAGFDNIAFNPMYENEHPSISITDEEFCNFMETIYNEWKIYNFKQIRIREIYSMLYMVQGKIAPICSSAANCTKFFSINFDGNIYLACERIIKSTKVGSIDSLNTFQGLKNTLHSRELVNTINNLPDDCKVCKLKDLCHNGCSAQRIDENGIKHLAGKYVYCNTRLHLYHKLETDLLIF